MNTIRHIRRFAAVLAAAADDPAAARRLTVRGNSVAVVSDGSAVLGLGDVGSRAALPVLEGKAALYKRFAGIDAWPLCLDVRDVPEMVRCVAAVVPGFGGVSLRTSPRRAASTWKDDCGRSWMCRYFTMTSTVPLSWSWVPWSARCG